MNIFVRELNKLRLTKTLLLLSLILLELNSVIAQDKDTLNYIFLGHIKKGRNGKPHVDERVEALDFSKYDRIWLGGDVTGESNLEYSLLELIDSLFDVSNPANHWTYGNHDLRNYNDEWLREITQKPTYYTHTQNGIVTIVLNPAITPTDCEKLNDQFAMIKSVCDTISKSSHLILLSHHCLWSGVPGLPHPGIYAHSNVKAWLANCYDKPATFVDVIYPLLVNVKNRGIEVINVLGDTGGSNKGQSMQSTEGIHFIASGIESKTENTYGPDKLLIFKHYPKKRIMEWDFHVLDSLR